MKNRKVKTLFITNQKYSRGTRADWHPHIFFYHDLRADSSAGNTQLQAYGRMYHYPSKYPEFDGRIELYVNKDVLLKDAGVVGNYNFRSSNRTNKPIDKYIWEHRIHKISNALQMPDLKKMLSGTGQATGHYKEYLEKTFPNAHFTYSARNGVQKGDTDNADISVKLKKGYAYKEESENWIIIHNGPSLHNSNYATNYSDYRRFGHI